MGEKPPCQHVEYYAVARLQRVPAYAVTMGRAARNRV
jgi:hypothetical protein